MSVLRRNVVWTERGAGAVVKLHDAAGQRYQAWVILRLGAWKRVPSEDPAKLSESIYVHSDHVAHVEIVRLIESRRKREYPPAFPLGALPEAPASHWPARVEVRVLDAPLLYPNGKRATKGYVSEDRMWLTEPHCTSATDAKGNVVIDRAALPMGEWFFDVVERPTDQWWQSERGTLERVASEYEIVHGLPATFGDGMIAKVRK